MNVQLLTEQHLEFLSLIGGCSGSSQSTLVKMPHCWKSYAPAQLGLIIMSPYSRLLIFAKKLGLTKFGQTGEIQEPSLHYL